MMNNKYQSALNNVIEAYQELQRRVGNNPDKVKDFDDITTLQELVDKETPMKVDKNTKGSFPNYDKDNTYHTTYKCPKCNCIIHLDWHEQRNFCPECAVKLDWRDINE